MLGFQRDMDLLPFVHMSPDWGCGKGTGRRGFASWERRGPPRPLCSAMPGKLDPLPATSLRLPRSTPCHGDHHRGRPFWRKPLTETQRHGEKFSPGPPTSSSASAILSDDSTATPPNPVRQNAEQILALAGFKRLISVIKYQELMPDPFDP